MGIYIGTQKIDHIYKGTTELSKIRIGEEMTSLIEGDDYMSYKWLCGRNGAYINTNHNLNPIQDVMIVDGRYDGTIRNPLGNEQAICGVVEEFSSAKSIWDYYYISTDNRVKACIVYSSKDELFPPGPVNDITKNFNIFAKIEGDYCYAYNNGYLISYKHRGVQDKLIGNVYLFTRNTENIPTQAAKRYFQGDISHFRITDPTFTTDRVNMTPVRLLHAIPSTFDANGIARNADECGMYNSVNGLFYGNVGSGSFSVTNE